LRVSVRYRGFGVPRILARCGVVPGRTAGEYRPIRVDGGGTAPVRDSRAVRQTEDGQDGTGTDGDPVPKGSDFGHLSERHGSVACRTPRCRHPISGQVARHQSCDAVHECVSLEIP
jgi:hypothetical protein